MEVDNELYRWLALALYTIACLSDFFDGYLARRFELESNFGRFLDPIADKILIVSIIFILIAHGKITGFFIYPALIIVLREILVSGLRDFFSHCRQNPFVASHSARAVGSPIVPCGAVGSPNFCLHHNEA